MSKGVHRFDKSDHISRIQANLKEMKDQVNVYLKKSNNDCVPPILRARHYLILSCINDLNSSKLSSIDNLQLIKDLSSQKLRSTLDGEKFESMRQAEGKNKIIKQKRVSNGKNNTSCDADCLLPNICQLKLDCDHRPNEPTPQKHLLMGKTMGLNHQYDSYDAFLKERRYHSIDLNKQSMLEQSQTIPFKSKNKWLSASESKELINTLRKKHSWSQQVGTSNTNSPQIRKDMVEGQKNVTVDLSKQYIQPSQALNKSRFAALQRRQSIQKRRIEANQKLAKQSHQPHTKGSRLNNRLQSPRKYFKFQKQRVEPSQPCKSQPKKKQGFLETNNNNECSPWVDGQKKQMSFLEADFF